jgi:hypothetical protein
MAEAPKAELVWRLHSAQWQMYSASGSGNGVLKATAPHWHRASIMSRQAAVFCVEQKTPAGSRFLIYYCRVLLYVASGQRQDATSLVDREV